MMDVRAVIRSQYLSALAMLGQTIERCPVELWTAGRAPFWQVAFHALSYADLYLQPTEADHVPRASHRWDTAMFRGDPGAPYSQADLLAYLEHCRAEVARLVPMLDPNEADPGFYWLRDRGIGKLELQFYGIRHIQQHCGELADRLGQVGIEIEWVSRQP